MFLIVKEAKQVKYPKKMSFSREIRFEGTERIASDFRIDKGLTVSSPE